VWSGNTSDAIGTTGTGIGTGYANTSALIDRNTNPGRAGTVARAFQGGGKTDWFLPSKDELNALCKWAYNDTVNTICNDSGSGGLSRTNGGFASESYISSSANSTGPEGQRFHVGSQFDTLIRMVFEYVRPVRAF
jgi:hypothetical protein